MSYLLAFGIAGESCERVLDGIHAIAAEYGFRVTQDDSAFGCYAAGVGTIAAHLGLPCVGVIAASGGENRVPEAWLIADGLVAGGKERDTALQFLAEMAAALADADSAAIFMASESWEANEPVLLYDGDVAFFATLMGQALGWRPPVFYPAAGIFADADASPLVMRLTKA